MQLREQVTFVEARLRKITGGENFFSTYIQQIRKRYILPYFSTFPPQSHKKNYSQPTPSLAIASLCSPVN